MDVRSLRVRRPDGSETNAGANAVKELEASAVRDAPAYATSRKSTSQYRRCGRGDILEYEIVNR